MGEDVVHLAGEPLPLAEGGGLGLGGAGLVQFRDELLGAVVGLSVAAGEHR